MSSLKHPRIYRYFLKNIFLTLFVIIGLVSCGNDDDMPVMDPPPSPKEMVDFELRFDDLGVQDAETFCVITDIDHNVLFEEYYSIKSETLTIKRPKDENIVVTHGSGKDGAFSNYSGLRSFIVSPEVDAFIVQEHYEKTSQRILSFNESHSRVLDCSDGFGDVFSRGGNIHFNILNVSNASVVQSGLAAMSGAPFPSMGNSLSFSGSFPFINRDGEQPEVFLVVMDGVTNEIKGTLIKASDVVNYKMELDFTDFEAVDQRFIDVNSAGQSYWLDAIGRTNGRHVFLSLGQHTYRASNYLAQNRFLLCLPSNTAFDNFKLEAMIDDEMEISNGLYLSKVVQEVPSELSFQFYKTNSKDIEERSIKYSFGRMHDVLSYSLILPNSGVVWSVLNRTQSDLDFTFPTLPTSLTEKYIELNVSLASNVLENGVSRIFQLEQGEQLPQLYSTNTLRELTCIPHFMTVDRIY